LYDSSFHLAKIQLYHWIDRLKIPNLQFFITGYAKSFNVTDTELTLEMAEPQEYLNREFRYFTTPASELYYSFYQPGSIDKVSEWRPVRRFYGMVDGVPLVNFASFKLSIEATANRLWAFASSFDTYEAIVRNTTGTPSTTTRTYVDQMGFNVGDQVIISSTSGGPFYREVTAVGANYIEHAAITSAASNIGSVTRQVIANITIIQNGNRFYPLPNRDYSISVVANLPNPWVVTFTSNFEVNLGMSTISSNDSVVARVYGITDLPTMNGAPFGSLDENYHSLTNGVVIIYGLLKHAGILESEIDLPTFTALAASLITPVGFAFPQTSNDSMSTYRDIIMRVCTSLMLQLFVNNQGKWTLRQVGLLKETPDASFDDLDFKDFSYKVSYDDIISKVNVRYGFQEANPDTSYGLREAWSVESVESSDMRFLHHVSREQDYDTALLRAEDANLLASRILTLLSERRGIVTIRGGSVLRKTEVGDTVEITGAESTRKFKVIEASKALNSVSLVLEDQRGIQQNPGVWSDS
jgi:hypothetical protein